MTPFHHIGNVIRDFVTAVPMPMVRVLFALFFISLIIWVWRLPKDRWMPEGVTKVDLSSNLRFWALIALLVQLAIYMIF
ncbi:MAG: hypothetical protein P1U89_17480 [Verrucomicrobiales bacterium]|nr:hypothetical protein [Verrucomicrobiales bacterium]